MKNKQQAGQAAVEYILILAILVSLWVASMNILVGSKGQGGAIIQFWQRLRENITSLSPEGEIKR